LAEDYIDTLESSSVRHTEGEEGMVMSGAKEGGLGGKVRKEDGKGESDESDERG
jgi:hypothetical protein